MSGLPKHIAIIMDGNGRWAEERGLSRDEGHFQGKQVVRTITEACAKQGVEALTLFALSVENLGRPEEEVAYLMRLFAESIVKHADELAANNIRFRVVGDLRLLPEELSKKIQQATETTATNTGMVMSLAINYSGRWDITQAAQNVAKKVKAGELDVDTIHEANFAKELCFADLPEPDLMIRTSGAQRISNFLLWQLAYTELYFTDCYWPDFNEQELQQAIQFYQQQERRFGLTSAQLKDK